MPSSPPNVIITPDKFQLVVGVNEDCTLEITNVGYEAIIFRMLTTTPSRYVVKNTKGVIRGNSSGKVEVALNRMHYRERVDPGVTRLTDDFRLECALLDPKDVVEPRCANVPQLIKDKKEADPQSVLRKLVNCRVVLNGEPTNRSSTQDAGATPQKGAESAAAQAKTAADPKDAVDARKPMTASEMEQNTLQEKNRRKEVAKAERSAATARPRGMAVKVVLAVAALVLAVAMWWMME